MENLLTISLYKHFGELVMYGRYSTDNHFKVIFYSVKVRRLIQSLWRKQKSLQLYFIPIVNSHIFGVKIKHICVCLAGVEFILGSVHFRFMFMLRVILFLYLYLGLGLGLGLDLRSGLMFKFRFRFRFRLRSRIDGLYCLP